MAYLSINPANVTSPALKPMGIAGLGLDPAEYTPTGLVKRNWKPILVWGLAGLAILLYVKSRPLVKSYGLAKGLGRYLKGR